MARCGFGNRSFAMPMKYNGNIVITVVRGKLSADQYSYFGGEVTRALQEITAYFKAHSEGKRSQHNLVIMPTSYNATSTCKTRPIP